MDPRCPACGAAGLDVFHEQDAVPTNSCLLLDSPEEARGFPRGTIRLAFCDACGFITNTAFEPGTAEYSARYEETQSYSPHFQAFARDLAVRWVHDHDLVGAKVVEIGCGKGEFLELMVEAGAGGGIGIDPGVHPDRRTSAAAQAITWVRDVFTAGYGPIDADAVVCRHTLEHIGPVREFLAAIRSSIGARGDTAVLFELPDVRRVLDDGAFWDVYYEHCSYFSAGSLARLFACCGFVVDLVEPAYDDQYLLLEARPAPVGDRAVPAPPLEDDLDALRAAVPRFAAACERRVRGLRTAVDEVAARGGRVVLWGGGSKAVAFLGALDRSDAVACAVDVNPHKQGRYLAGTGHEVVAPLALRAAPPDLVVAMNGVYRTEIRAQLDRLGLHDAELVGL